MAVVGFLGVSYLVSPEAGLALMALEPFQNVNSYNLSVIPPFGTCAGFAAVCGSSPATEATMGTVALPEMKRFKFHPRLATGSVTAGGTIGILIPPSVLFIIYGIMTQ